MSALPSGVDVPLWEILDLPLIFAMCQLKWIETILKIANIYVCCKYIHKFYSVFHSEHHNISTNCVQIFQQKM